MKPATVNTATSRRTLPQLVGNSIASADQAASVTCVQLDQVLAAEMRRSWRRGERLPADFFLNKHPELWQQPDAAVELIYEEFCLRQTEGPETVEQDLLRRFPQWVEPLRVMLDCHRLLQTSDELPQFPEVGDTVAEFRLLAELGRGSRGQVFLASQLGLADRAVVLKVTPCDGGEHLSLARLQHTNIVPLYSCSDDPVRKIRILCMPYFGSATLTAVFKSLSRIPLVERTGQHVVSAIDHLQDASAPAIAGAARQMLSHVSYVQAMCWITACLADALQFAHERGLVHLDLKPSNVLLSTDGQPMLLDFHLAHAPIFPNSIILPDNFGGTPGYMPAEQVAAMEAIQTGKAVAAAVDGRADIYALGAILRQALGGPLPNEKDSPPLTQFNPQVSRGLSEIVAKCIAVCPDDRYASAAALAEDLRRHLTDQPLVGVSNRSLPERLRKWRRRRPNRIRTAAMLVVAIGAVAMLLAGAWRQNVDRREQAAYALNDGRAQLQNCQSRDTAERPEEKASDFGYAEAVRTFERGLEHAASLPFDHDLQRQLRGELATARRLHLAHQVHDLAEEVRAAYGADSLPLDRLRILASQGRTFWDKRHAIAKALDSAQDAAVKTDLQDIALFVADLQVKLTDGTKPGAGHDALRMLDEVEAMFGPSAVLDCQRQIHRKKLGLAQSASAAPPTPSTAWEYYALGRAYLAADDLTQASEKLAQALALDPAGRWPNFYYGLCAFRMGRHEDSLAAFSVCIGTAPKSAACFCNRGLVYAALDRHAEALRDYDRALEIDPHLAAASLNRRILLDALPSKTAEHQATR